MSYRIITDNAKRSLSLHYYLILKAHYEVLYKEMQVDLLTCGCAPHNAFPWICTDFNVAVVLEETIAEPYSFTMLMNVKSSHLYF